MTISMRHEVPARGKMLWAAVLRRAVFDYVLYKGVRKQKMIWQRAYQYIFTPNQEYDNGLGFEQVCELFGWDPDYVRRLTTELSRQDIKRMETTSFRDEYTQDVMESFVKNSGRWKTSGFAIPFYPRMVDEYTPVTPVKAVRHQAPSHTPIVNWQATL
jgi:hypothetical protein